MPRTVRETKGDLNLRELIEKRGTEDIEKRRSLMVQRLA